MGKNKPKIDLTNQKFNQLTVLEYLGNSEWRCQCNCGNQTIVKTSSLNSGKTKSCGCLKGNNTKHNKRNCGPRIDITGQKFGILTPIEYKKGGMWLCQCDCGQQIIVDTRNLNSGHTKSCGCLKKDGSKRVIDMSNFENENIKVLERAGSDNQGAALWKCLCKNCKSTFITRGSNIRNGDTKSCGCIHSLNEKKIIQILSENNIEFATQYIFPDLFGENNGHLRFDFAIFNNGVLKHLIEFNGKQHYEQAQGSWADGFDCLQRHDQLKKEYCKLHNIELRIIKYNEKYELKDLI